LPPGESPLAKLSRELGSTDGVTWEVTVGSIAFLRANDRWPQSREEIEEGLAAAKLPANRLKSVSQIAFREEEGVLFVEFVEDGEFPLKLSVRLSPNEMEEAIQSPQQQRP
jgi:hypothetical protein